MCVPVCLFVYRGLEKIHRKDGFEKALKDKFFGRTKIIPGGK